MTTIINAMITAYNDTPVQTNVAQYDAVVSSVAARRTHATLEAVIADAAVLAGSNVLIDGDTFTQAATLDISKKLYIYGLGDSTFEAGAALGANPIIQFSVSGSRFQGIALDANALTPTYAIQIDPALFDICLDVELIGAFATGDIDNQATDEAIIGFVKILTGNYLLPIGSPGANSALSNLSSPTAVNEDIVWDTNNTYSLGNDTLEAGILWTHEVSHGDAVNPTLAINTSSDDGDIVMDPDGTGQVIIKGTLELDNSSIEEVLGDLQVLASAGDLELAASVDVVLNPASNLALVDITGNEQPLVWSDEVQTYTTTGEVGTDALQQQAGHDLTADEETTIGPMIAMYNLADDTDLSGNANTLDDADAYSAGTGIMAVATTAHLGVNGQHLQADAISDFSGAGDKDVSMGGWHKMLISGGGAAVGTNAAAQKIQYYTNAAGNVVFDFAGVLQTSSSVVTGVWTHIAIVYDSTNSIGCGFINGVCECCTNATTNLDLQAAPSIWVNSKADGTLEVASTHDEVAVYEGVWTQREIKLLCATKIAEPAMLAGLEYELVEKIRPAADAQYEYTEPCQVVLKYNAFIYRQAFGNGTTDTVLVKAVI